MNFAAEQTTLSASFRHLRLYISPNSNSQSNAAFVLFCQHWGRSHLVLINFIGIVTRHNQLGGSVPTFSVISHIAAGYWSEQREHKSRRFWLRSVTENVVQDQFIQRSFRCGHSLSSPGWLLSGLHKSPLCPPSLDISDFPYHATSCSP